MPYRGKRNEPAHVVRVVETLAGMHQTPVADLARRTRRPTSTACSGRDKVLNVKHVEKSSPALSQIFEPIRADLQKVDEEFARHVQSKVGLIPQIGQYIQTSGGKRIRPAVLLMASRLVGYTGDRSILYAAVVEFIHTATLVHDDIIDDSNLRRGRLAVHSRWGNDITVLLGDYLYIKSMAMALTHDELDIVRNLCDVTLRMIEGELYQLTKNGDAGITEDEHFDIMRRKTAYLFGGCAQIGGMLGKVSSEQRAGAAGVRLQSRHRVPAGRRPARLHRRCRSASASRSPATCAKAR